MTSTTTHMKDYKSSLLYFSARHYDAELTTMWLSVDPMADKYPGVSPQTLVCNSFPGKFQ